ncbi:MAG TPA: pirin family protein [Alphaproteobacteria bacterium]|nr:pirin family protein [Alphaproteobacteria bacterium]
MAAMTTIWRSIERLVRAEPTSDGAGVNLNRTIASAALPELDPFLLLDEFNTENPGDYIAGFPDHPHRGFETVTYMIEGNMRHADSTGTGGVLRSGGIQWMTAGRGIVHSEMPEQEGGKMQGFQLWVNLPATLKMSTPRYQEFDPDKVPEIRRDDGARIRIVVGAHDGTDGIVSGIAVEPLYLDVTLPPGVSLEQPIAAGHNGFVYLFAGESVSVTNTNGSADGVIPYRHLAVLGDGDRLGLTNNAEQPARMLVVAGRPIGEPIARYGPFVMNTREEIFQAFKDYEEGRF